MLLARCHCAADGYAGRGVAGQDGADQDARADGTGVRQSQQPRGIRFGAVFSSPVLRSRLPFVSRLWVFTLKYDIVWIAINRDFFVLYLGTCRKNPVKSRVEGNMYNDEK